MRRILHEASAFMVNECLMAGSRRQTRQRRLFRCAAGIVGGHHAGAPTMPRPAAAGLVTQVTPWSLSEEKVAPFLCPSLRSRKRSPRRELQPKRIVLSSLEFPFLHASEALCLATLFVAPLALTFTVSGDSSRLCLTGIFAPSHRTKDKSTKIIKGSW
jgi:hypothetical protein